MPEPKTPEDVERALQPRRRPCCGRVHLRPRARRPDLRRARRPRSTVPAAVRERLKKAGRDPKDPGSRSRTSTKACSAGSRPPIPSITTGSGRTRTGPGRTPRPRSDQGRHDRPGHGRPGGHVEAAAAVRTGHLRLGPRPAEPADALRRGPAQVDRRELHQPGSGQGPGRLRASPASPAGPNGPSPGSRTIPPSPRPSSGSAGCGATPSTP